MPLVFQIFLALLLDYLLGDPRSWPHPVRLIGRLAAYLELFCRKHGSGEKSTGILTVLLTLSITGVVVSVFLYASSLFHPRVEDIFSVLILYTCFAARDLIKHSLKVYEALRTNNLAAAREKVSMMVGRDTAGLDEEGVARACVESVAENIVDGVTAPLFYAFLGGPLGAVLYKAVNTLDSIFGYKNEKYREFGWAAARLDDVVNFVPARITGLLVVVVSIILRFRYREAWCIFWRDRLQHSSPNAGQTEAAVAGALGLQFGGINYYFGEKVTKPTIGDFVMPAGPQHILQVNRIVYTVTFMAAILFYFCYRTFQALIFFG